MQLQRTRTRIARVHRIYSNGYKQQSTDITIGKLSEGCFKYENMCISKSEAVQYSATVHTETHTCALCNMYTVHK